MHLGAVNALLVHQVEFDGRRSAAVLLIEYVDLRAQLARRCFGVLFHIEDAAASAVPAELAVAELEHAVIAACAHPCPAATLDEGKRAQRRLRHGVAFGRLLDRLIDVSREPRIAGPVLLDLSLCRR